MHEASLPRMEKSFRVYKSNCQERRSYESNEKPIVALMYDFDKTLCTKDMQEYGFIPELGMTTADFWREANGLTDKDGMDGILAYMFMMVKMSSSMKCRLPGKR